MQAEIEFLGSMVRILMKCVPAVAFGTSSTSDHESTDAPSRGVTSTVILEGPWSLNPEEKGKNQTEISKQIPQIPF